MEPAIETSVSFSSYSCQAWPHARHTFAWLEEAAGQSFQVEPQIAPPFLPNAEGEVEPVDIRCDPLGPGGMSRAVNLRLRSVGSYRPPGPTTPADAGVVSFLALEVTPAWRAPPALTAAVYPQMTPSAWLRR